MSYNCVIVLGPTAVGKTAIGVALARAFNGEIISSDSMQIYKDMNIGTAKVTEEEAQGIKHYLVDFVSPEQRYSVSDFKRDAEEALEEIIAKGKTPIVVGGTGLYVNSLIYGIDYQDMEYDKEYRNELMEKAESEEGLKSLYEEALKIDPEAMEKISTNDKKRITRVLEIYKQTGMTKTKQEELSRLKEIKYDYRVFAITMPREELYERINLRVDLMIKDGLIEEVESLLKKYKNFPTAMQGLGYKEVVEYLNGEYSKEEMIDKIKQETRHYAKRQLTWFRRNKEIIWLDKNDGIEKNMEIISEGMK